MSRFDPFAFIKNKFLKDTATLQASSVINKVSQVASSIAIAFLLGAHGQGLFVLAVSLQAFLFNLLNVGVLQATIVQVAAASARGQKEKLTQWLAFLVKAYFAINTVVLAVAYLVLPWVAERWYDHRELGIWAFWLCFFPFIDTVRVAVFAALQGTRRMLLIAQLDNSTEIVRGFLVVTGAVITRSPEGAVLGEIAARVVFTPIAVSLYRAGREDGGSYLPRLREVVAEVRGVPLIRGLRLGLRVGFIKNTHSLFLTVVPGLMLGGLAGASWVAWFNVARRFMDLPWMLMQGVTRTALPALSEVAGVRDAVRFRRLFLRITRLGAVLVTAGVIAFLPFVKPLARILYPPDYVEPVFQYAAILALGYAMTGGLVAIEAFYIVTNQMRKSLVLTVVGALITVPLNFVLMIAFPQWGVAWGQVLYGSWALVHYTYVAWWFRHRKHETMWVEAPAETAGEPEGAGEDVELAAVDGPERSES